jgi:hypothetical protein
MLGKGAGKSYTTLCGQTYSTYYPTLRDLAASPPHLGKLQHVGLVAEHQRLLRFRLEPREALLQAAWERLE